MKVKFYFEPSDLKRWFRAMRNIVKEAKKAEKQLPFEGATAYRNQVLSNLTHQRFGWQRLSPYYAEWKKEHGYPAKHWMMRGELIAAVKVFRAKGIRNREGWAGGVEPNAFAPHIGWSNKARGNIKIVKYALWNEEGTRNQPARPLFMPTAYQYASEGWPKLAATYHNRFRSVWR